MAEVAQALDTFETDRSVAAIIITGSEKAFAAGADIKEMLNNTYSECVRENFLDGWARVSKTSKPVIAAVNGYAVSLFCALRMRRFELTNQKLTVVQMH